MSRSSYRKTVRTNISGRCGKGLKGLGWSELLTTYSTAERTIRAEGRKACRNAMAEV